MYIGVRGLKTSETHHAQEYGLSNNISHLDRTPTTYFSRKTNYRNTWVSPRFVNATVGDLPSPSTCLSIPRCTGYIPCNMTLCIKGLTAHITQIGELTYVGNCMSYKHPERMIYGYIDHRAFAMHLDHRKNVIELSGRYVLVEGHQERSRDCDR
jgi:hypothetical protein